jgi:hypothetical protein
MEINAISERRSPPKVVENPRIECRYTNRSDNVIPVPSELRKLPKKRRFRVGVITDW